MTPNKSCPTYSSIHALHIHVLTSPSLVVLCYLPCPYLPIDYYFATLSTTVEMVNPTTPQQVAAVQAFIATCNQLFQHAAQFTANTSSRDVCVVFRRLQVACNTFCTAMNAPPNPHQPPIEPITIHPRLVSFTTQTQKDTFYTVHPSFNEKDWNDTLGMLFNGQSATNQPGFHIAIICSSFNNPTHPISHWHAAALLWDEANHDGWIFNPGLPAQVPDQYHQLLRTQNPPLRIRQVHAAYGISNVRRFIGYSPGDPNLTLDDDYHWRITGGVNTNQAECFRRAIQVAIRAAQSWLLGQPNGLGFEDHVQRLTPNNQTRAWLDLAR